MSFYRNRIYPLLVRRLGNPEPIRRLRAQVLPWARGTVLELGVGTGANFPYYQAERVRKLFALEPNPGMVRRARAQQWLLNCDVEYIDLPGEQIPLNESTVDTVVTTFTLCTIDAVQDAIGEIRRVLNSDGRLVFIELGQAPDPAVQRWQKFLDPVARWIYAGLRLTRHIPTLLTEGGFAIQHMDEDYLASFPKALTYSWWGIALPQAQG
jgi:ubiquinone/menaquinone biosynthesis C-methylase UbiE